MKRIITLLLAAILVVSLAGLAVFAADGDSKSDPVEIVGTDTAETTDTKEPDDTTEPAETTDTEEPVDTTDTAEPVETKEPDETKEPEDTDESDKSIIDVWRGESGRPFPWYKSTVDEDGNANPGWALLNLICTVATVIFGGVATGEAIKVKKNKEEYDYNNERYVVLKNEKNETAGGVSRVVTEFKRKGKLWKTGFFDLLSGAGAIVAFILTENIYTPMYITDKWTPLMVAILAVGVIVWRLTAGGKKLKGELVEKIMNFGVRK